MRASASFVATERNASSSCASSSAACAAARAPSRRENLFDVPSVDAADRAGLNAPCDEGDSSCDDEQLRSELSCGDWRPLTRRRLRLLLPTTLDATLDGERCDLEHEAILGDPPRTAWPKENSESPAPALLAPVTLITQSERGVLVAVGEQYASSDCVESAEGAGDQHRGEELQGDADEKCGDAPRDEAETEREIDTGDRGGLRVLRALLRGAWLLPPLCAEPIQVCSCWESARGGWW